MDNQVCKTCEISKPLTTAHFARGYNKRNGISFFYWRKKCKACDKDRVLQKDRAYKEKNREKLAAAQREYHANNKSNDSETKKQWYQKNKDAVKARVKKNIKARRKCGSTFRLRESISANIRGCIKKNFQPFAKFLPYTIRELKEHLEKQFESWMTWDNYGTYRVDIWDDNDSGTWTWQLDHIIPHSKFNYSSMEDKTFKDCWELCNLRPFSAKQNIIDGSRK